MAPLLQTQRQQAQAAPPCSSANLVQWVQQQQHVHRRQVLQQE
jgi:hypothetical protein